MRSPTSGSVGKAGRANGQAVNDLAEAVVSFTESHGYAPTVRELCGLLNVTSTSTVHSFIESAVRRGLIVKAKNRSRTIQLVPED